MKKKFLLILLFLCISVFMPRKVFAITNNIYNNRFIDYRFSIKDNQGNSIEGLHFKLYDQQHQFSFESNYNSEEKYYYFKFNSDNDISTLFPNNLRSFYVEGYSWPVTKCNIIQNDFKDIVDIVDYSLGSAYCWDRSEYWGGNAQEFFFSASKAVPLIIEGVDIDYKKIVFGTVHYSLNTYNLNQDEYTDFYTLYDFYLVNNNVDYNLPDDYLFNYWGNFNYSKYTSMYPKVDENASFMRNAMYDYSDELWEELNSGPIASSEMQYDNSDTELNSPKVITLKTNDAKAIYSKYNSNVNYRFKVKNGNGMKFSLHDVSNTFSFSSKYDKNSDTYSIVDNSSDSDYQDGIKEFSKIIIDEVKNGNFSDLATKYKSITSNNCTSANCNIYTYIPLILEGEGNTGYAKQIVLGLVNVQYKEENGNDYYDIGLNVYNNTCDLLNSNIDADMSQLINLSRAIEEDYSNDLMDKYSNGSVSLEDIIKSEDINSLKDKYCNELPVISLRQNPKTLNNGIVVLIISMMIVIGSSVLIIKRRNVKV